MKKVGILGGTFDPPHIGHLLIAEEARMQMELDEIWWMPNYLPPHKERSNASVEDRLEMVRMMTMLDTSYHLCEIELARHGPSYTVDTMEQLTKEYPKIEFYFIIGEDSLETLDNWIGIERLKTLVSFIVIPRPGYCANSSDMSGSITVLNSPTIDVSSTVIRETIRKSGRINRFLLTNNVYSYMKERSLYDE